MKRVNHFWLIVLGLFAGSQSTLAQDANAPQKFSLKEAIDYAVKANTSVRSAKLDNDIANARVKEVRAIGLPQVNGEVQLVHNFKLQPNFFAADNPFLNNFGGNLPPAVDGVVTSPNLFQLKNSGTASATINQLIFDGSYLVGLKAATTYTELSKRSLTASKITVAENTSKAYYGVLIAQERIALLDKNINRLDSLYKQTQALQKNGFVEKIDVDRLEVSLNNLKIERQKTDRLIELSRALLRFQMGLPAQTPLVLTEKLDNNSVTGISEVAAGNFDYTQRIEFQSLQTQKALNQLEIKNVQAGYYPKLYAFATGGYVTGNPKFGKMLNPSRNWERYGLGGFTLQLPIFDGFQKKYKMQQVRLNTKKLELSTEQLKNGIDLELQQANTNLSNSFESLKIQKRNMELATEVVRVSKIKYQQGVGSNIEVTNAETSLKEAQTNYYGALYDAIIAKIDLDKATGKLYAE